MWKRREVELYNELLIKDSKMPLSEVLDYQDYMTHWSEMNDLMIEFPGHDIFDAPRAKKDEWNRLSTELSTYELRASNTPIFHEMRRKLEEEKSLPEFLQEGKPITMEVAGWYQNLRGDLYHYNGMVWDKGVPGRSEELEFLGGK